MHINLLCSIMQYYFAYLTMQWRFFNSMVIKKVYVGSEDEKIR